MIGHVPVIECSRPEVIDSLVDVHTITYIICTQVRPTHRLVAFEQQQASCGASNSNLTNWYEIEMHDYQSPLFASVVVKASYY